jgi:hypothetical protein
MFQSVSWMSNGCDIKYEYYQLIIWISFLGFPCFEGNKPMTDHVNHAMHSPCFEWQFPPGKIKVWG